MNPIGDLTRSMLLQTQNSQLKGRIESLSVELATGKSSDIRLRAGGKTGDVFSIQHEIGKILTFQTSISESETILKLQQSAIETTGDSLSRVFSPALAGMASETRLAAEGAFKESLNSLRLAVAGRNAFDWAQELPSTEEIVSQLRSDIANSPGNDEDTIRTALTGMMVTSATPTDAPIGNNQSLRLSQSTAPSVVVETLVSLATAFLSPSTFQSPRDIKNWAEGMLRHRDGLIQFQATIGMKQEQLERTQARNASQLSALRLTESKMISADPFEVAVDLKEAEIRLDALMTATARLSRLSLTNYL